MFRRIYDKSNLLAINLARNNLHIKEPIYYNANSYKFLSTNYKQNRTPANKINKPQDKIQEKRLDIKGLFNPLELVCKNFKNNMIS
jgi:hypothetical protein